MYESRHEESKLDKQDMVTLRVRVCANCDSSHFYIASDNRIACATCKRFVKGYHAIGVDGLMQ